ncbi:hypothetical protein [Clostridium perfringens]|uniref:hypothetical protein n=1 Tax=Clostridium perfringens TaxID=1502 RepID=UPI0013E2D9C1|nr:hypothetical protein [Clostridium perfringens]MBI6055108.1 hypothetical protein [Clostridium perfringens]MBO3324958.1 hypothetical protein [Clostridium perfringens]MDT7916918.1 hypothetical protein [Clostridium perfringens]MDT7936150.1 hypothetical protein [Clostridium perfringens]MDT7939296.1 hypothetical protein [Clostridium perfringens]
MKRIKEFLITNIAEILVFFSLSIFIICNLFINVLLGFYSLAIILFLAGLLLAKLKASNIKGR